MELKSNVWGGMGDSELVSAVLDAFAEISIWNWVGEWELVLAVLGASAVYGLEQLAGFGILLDAWVWPPRFEPSAAFWAIVSPSETLVRG